MKRKSTFAIILVFVFLMTQTAFAVSPINSEAALVTDEITELVESIPEEAFGGIYYNEDGDLVLRVKDTDEMPISSFARSATVPVVVEHSDYSLAELEAMKESIVPYMTQYYIISLDANEAKGTIDVEVSQTHDGLVDILSKLCDIDPEILRVSVSEMRLDYTFASAPAESVPEEYIEYFGLGVSPADSRIAVTIFPGLNIAVNNSGFENIGYSYGTAGPRYNSTQFFSAGHLITGSISSPKVLAALSSDEIGRVNSYVLGSSGDRSTISVTNSNFVLPTSNSLGVNGGRYTHTYTSVMGASVEMWGAYSGITTGTVLATNQVKTVGGTTIRNLTKTNYPCRQGDSGAAVFSLNAAYDSSAKCYGIQSIGEFYGNATVSTYSYYSPIAGYGF